MANKLRKLFSITLKEKKQKIEARALTTENTEHEMNPRELTCPIHNLTREERHSQFLLSNIPGSVPKRSPGRRPPSAISRIVPSPSTATTTASALGLAVRHLDSDARRPDTRAVQVPTRVTRVTRV